MALRNRVDPWGSLHAAPQRGTLLGNRGNLHDDGKQVRRLFKRKSWVLCALEFGGRRRDVFAPGKYSELFFLDEATALSAGHRPCNTCRPDRLKDFRLAFARTPIADGASAFDLPAIDERLHAERISGTGKKVTFEATVSSLPAGTLVELDGAAWLIWGGQLHRWTFGGYVERRAIPLDRRARVLTPGSVVRAFAAGFAPDVHASATA